MRKWIFAIVVLVVAAGAGWYFGSPWWTLYQVKQAAERKDVDTLIGYIDFDALRSDLKAQMRELNHIGILCTNYNLSIYPSIDS